MQATALLHRLLFYLPFITQKLALVVFLSAETSHENVPVTSKGVWDAYTKSFLSERADLHFTLFFFSHSHVCLSMLLVLAPESIIILSLHPPLMISIFSCFFSSPTVNAYSGRLHHLEYVRYLGTMWRLVFFFLLHVCVWSCNALGNVLRTHICDKADPLLSSSGLYQDAQFYHIGSR